jgi:hypothetical protein
VRRERGSRCRPGVTVLKAGALYFALTFGTGFVLGTIRVFWLVPRLGERTAELLEAPVMLVVVILAARWVTRRLRVPAAPAIRLGMGLVALALLVGVEFSVVFWLRGLTIDRYLASRDPVAGVAYVVLLAVFAIMPVLVARR